MLLVALVVTIVLSDAAPFILNSAQVAALALMLQVFAVPRIAKILTEGKNVDTTRHEALSRMVLDVVKVVALAITAVLLNT